MRDLIIMRGCPGCGKSTAIEESGMCFERDFEVDRNGNILKDEDIEHNNYTWDSINPLIGG